jgi:hypothetical protein
MATTASSQFGLVFLCMMSIGLLLLMAPQFGTGKFVNNYSAFLLKTNTRNLKPWNATSIPNSQNQAAMFQRGEVQPGS